MSFFRLTCLANDCQLQEIVDATGQEVLERRWTRGGRFHRDDDQPAVECRAPHQPFRREWFENGFRHRRHGPAIVEWSVLGEAIRQEWWHFGVMGRPPHQGGPSRIVVAGDVVVMTWSRPAGGLSLLEACMPLLRSFNRTDGSLTQSLWVAGSRRHRTDGPADELYADPHASPVRDTTDWAWMWLGTRLSPEEHAWRRRRLLFQTHMLSPAILACL